VHEGSSPNAGSCPRRDPQGSAARRDDDENRGGGRRWRCWEDEPERVARIRARRQDRPYRRLRKLGEPDELVAGVDRQGARADRGWSLGAVSPLAVGAARNAAR